MIAIKYGGHIPEPPSNDWYEDPDLDFYTENVDNSLERCARRMIASLPDKNVAPIQMIREAFQELRVEFVRQGFLDD
jgi:chorismate mutase